MKRLSALVLGGQKKRQKTDAEGFEEIGKTLNSFQAGEANSRDVLRLLAREQTRDTKREAQLFAFLCECVDKVLAAPAASPVVEPLFRVFGEFCACGEGRDGRCWANTKFAVALGDHVFPFLAAESKIIRQRTCALFGAMFRKTRETFVFGENPAVDAKLMKYVCGLRERVLDANSKVRVAVLEALHSAGVHVLKRRDEELAEALRFVVLSDSSASVRLAALDCLWLDNESDAALLVSRLFDCSPLVQKRVLSLMETKMKLKVVSEDMFEQFLSFAFGIARENEETAKSIDNIVSAWLRDNGGNPRVFGSVARKMLLERSENIEQFAVSLCRVHGVAIEGCDDDEKLRLRYICGKNETVATSLDAWDCFLWNVYLHTLPKSHDRDLGCTLRNLCNVIVECRDDMLSLEYLLGVLSMFGNFSDPVIRGQTETAVRTVLSNFGGEYNIVFACLTVLSNFCQGERDFVHFVSELLSNIRNPLEEDVQTQADDATVTLCLNIVCGLLTMLKKTLPNAFMRGICDTYILPNIAQPSLEVRQVAIKALGCYCIFDKRMAKDFQSLFSTILQNDETVVKIVALQSIVDIFVSHGVKYFGDDNGELVGKIVESAATPELKEICLEGLSRLFYVGAIESVEIMVFVLSCFFNEKHIDPTQRIVKVLEVFFARYFSSPKFSDKHQQLLISACPLLLDLIANEEVPASNEFPRFLSRHLSQENMFKLGNELVAYSEKDAQLVGSLVKQIGVVNLADSVKTLDTLAMCATEIIDDSQQMNTFLASFAEKRHELFVLSKPVLLFVGFSKSSSEKVNELKQACASFGINVADDNAPIGTAITHIVRPNDSVVSTKSLLCTVLGKWIMNAEWIENAVENGGFCKPDEMCGCRARKHVFEKKRVFVADAMKLPMEFIEMLVKKAGKGAIVDNAKDADIVFGECSLDGVTKLRTTREIQEFMFN